MENRSEVIIVGAGIAGLTAAKILKVAGKKVKIIEASDSIGGRVRTDEVDGFKLDRGFQVLLTAYPEAKELLDYERLQLSNFRPGASVLRKNGITEIGDPFREPSMLFKTLVSPIGSLKDKLLMLKLKIKLLSTSIPSIFSEKESSTMAYLKDFGFSESMIQQFLRPFFAGIFLESKLDTSSRMFEFVFKMFGEGYASLPKGGMQMIPNQLAETLDKEDFLFNQRVHKILDSAVYTENGDCYHADYIVIATEGIGMPSPLAFKELPAKSALTVYFSAPKQSVERKLIALNSSDQQLCNNVAFIDSIVAGYAPAGYSLIAVSVIDDQDIDSPDLEKKLLEELVSWYSDAMSWKHLKTYRIPYALPNNKTVTNKVGTDNFNANSNCFICGDHLLYGAIDGAMKSGRLAAEAVLKSKKI